MDQRIRIDRLRKLAEHLITGKLMHSEFNYGVYHNIHRNRSCGCAVGELPAVFPEDFEYVYNNAYMAKIRKFDNPFLYDRSRAVCKKYIALTDDGGKYVADEGEDDLVQESACEFFGLTMEMYCHLFIPTYQNLTWTSEQLQPTATKEEVANLILKFCNLVERGEIKWGERIKQNK